MPLHIDVFRDQIWGFLCNDIESCLTAAEDAQRLGSRSKFKGRLNFPAAAMLLSAIDLATGYYFGRKPKSEDVAVFIAKYLGRHAPKLADEKIAKKWYEVFRHGLAHAVSPKAGSVSMDSNPEVFFFALSGNEKIPVLVVPALFAALKGALRDYEAELDASTALQQQFQQRYEELVKDDYRAMRAFRTLCGE